jgi:drug/metabolite transporter (DMT)-like permease
MKSQKKAYIYAIVAVLCWSTIGSAFKISLHYTDFINLLLYSSGVACLILLTVILIQGKWRSLLSSHLKDLLSSAFMGLLNPFLYYLVLLKAYDLLPAQEAGTLNYIWPLVLVLLSIPMLKQQISPWSILAIGISFLGIIVISTHGDLTTLDFSDPIGVTLAVGSAIFWALYWICNMKDPRESLIKLFLNFFLGFLYIFTLNLIVGGIIFPTFPLLFGATYIGVFEMGITFIIWLKALQYSANTAKVSNLIYLSPFISLIIIHFLVGEDIRLSTLIGLILIVGGIILQQYLKK